MQQNELFKWKGFNLLDMISTTSTGDFSEDDFKWIAELGFNFVRIPLCYKLWLNNGDVYDVNEEVLKKVDRAVELGDKYNLHINLNFHKAPGYSVNPAVIEPWSLWDSEEAVKAFCFHWGLMAQRYKGISSKRLSFNPLNEPPEAGERMPLDAHTRAITEFVKTVRGIDSERLMIVDGVRWGTQSCPELAELNVIQSCRAYYPFELTHYQADWVGADINVPPTWPMSSDVGGFRYGLWDKDRLYSFYAEWGDMIKQGVGVHCGEGGCTNRTPHKIMMAWFTDVMEVLNSLKIGFALWHFRGIIGVLDSERDDVDYEDFHGHKLDRKLLDLLMK